MYLAAYHWLRLQAIADEGTRQAAIEQTISRWMTIHWQVSIFLRKCEGILKEVTIGQVGNMNEAIFTIVTTEAQKIITIQAVSDYCVPVERKLRKSNRMPPISVVLVDEDDLEWRGYRVKHIDELAALEAFLKSEWQSVE